MARHYGERLELLSLNDRETTQYGTGPDALAALPAGIRIRTVRWLALALAVGGLILLHWSARHRELPYISAADLTPSMQFAPVRARGILAELPRIHRRDGEVTVVAFGLRQNGDLIHAVAFGETARVLAHHDVLAEPGSHLEITGVVQFSPRYGPQIQLRLAEHVELMEPAAQERSP